MSEAFDLLIVGGGINGVGIARDAAGRGLSVLLCEKGDLAGATSSASSKLVHGGLRYLEHGDFRLVRESLGRMARPDDSAAVVVFLASDDARHVTGQTVHLNGGSYMP